MELKACMDQRYYHSFVGVYCKRIKISDTAVVAGQGKVSFGCNQDNHIGSLEHVVTLHYSLCELLFCVFIRIHFLDPTIFDI